MSQLRIEERIGHHVKRAEQELIAAKHAALRSFNLNMPQYTVLLVLGEEPGLSGAALARRCLVTPQTMSSVLATMERRSLIERKPHRIHSHILEARLTRSGRNLLGRADAAASEIEQKLADAFSAKEVAQFLEYLGRCSGVLSSTAK